MWKSAVCIIIRRTKKVAKSYLYDSLSSGDLENLTLPALTVAKLDVDNFGVSEPQKIATATDCKTAFKTNLRKSCVGEKVGRELTWGI